MVGSTESQTDAAEAGRKAPPNGDLGRVERGMRNLAFELEQDQRKLETKLSAVNEQLDALQAQFAGPDAPLAPRATPEPAEAPDGAQVSGELEALRRDVVELHRSVAELRRLKLARSKRRRLFRRGAARKRRRAQRRQQRRVRARRAARRTARLPRRARLRALRVARRSKAIVRERLFARRLGSLNHHAPKELKIPRRYQREIKLERPPTISIVTPSYNQGRFLERTMLSVLQQDYPRLEYVVQDGGSTDETEQVLARHADRLHHYEMREDEGQADAINLGFEHSTGEVMAYLNSDDVLMPGSLHYVARYFERHPEVDVVYGHRVLVDEEDREIGRWIMPRHDDDVLSWADFVPQETMFWRRRIWEKSGGAMDKEWYLILDWDLIVRFREAGANFKRLPRFLGGFRIHEVQKTSADMDSRGRAEMDRLRERLIGHEVTRREISKGVAPYLRRHHVLQKMYRARLLRY